MSKGNGKLVWYAPNWSTAPKQWWALRKYVLSPAPILRITVATTVVVFAVLAGFKIAFPGIVFPNLLPLLFVFPALVVMLVFQTAVLSLFKARILVTRKKILISHGQAATIIKPECLMDVTLTVHDNDRARIRFCYSKKGKSKFVNVGFSDDCDLFRLAELLPVEVTTRDARRTNPDAT